MHQVQAFQLAEANFFNMISVDRIQTDHLRAFATGVQSPTLNHAVVYHVDEDFQKSLRSCCDFYANKHVPWELGVSDKDYHALGAILHQHAFVEVDTGVAMALLLQDLKVNPTPGALEMRDMWDSLDEWSTPVTLGFESTREQMQPYTFRHQMASKDNNAIIHFSGFVDNQAICSLTMTFCDDNVRIDDVATIPQYQRKGYATQLLLSALAHAKSLGSQCCFLEASNDGLSVYEHIGFKMLFKSHYYEVAK